MAETMFYDVYPERDPEGALTKFITTADNIESACPQQLELSEELAKTKGGSDEPAVEGMETADSSGVPLDDEGRRIYHRNVLAATRNLRCIADTGSALHVRSLDDIPLRERQMIVEALRPIQLQTANGETPVSQQIATKISKLGCTKDMYVLKDSPSIISVGRLVLDDGYDFYWRHKDKKAVLIRPDGRRIVLENDNYTPMLTIKETVANNISEINADAVAAPVWEDSESEAETTEGADSRKFFIEMFSGTGGPGRGDET